MSVTAYAEDSGEVTYIEDEQSYSDTTPTEEQDGSDSSEPSEPLEDEELEEDEDEDIPEDTSLNEDRITDEELQHYKDVAAIRYYLEIFLFAIFPVWVAVNLIYFFCKWFEHSFLRV